MPNVNMATNGRCNRRLNPTAVNVGCSIGHSPVLSLVELWLINEVVRVHPIVTEKLRPVMGHMIEGMNV